MTMREPTQIERLIALWDHLGLQSAHVATQIPQDIAFMAEAHPGRIAGLMLCQAFGIKTESLRDIASHTLLVAGDRGLTATIADAATAKLPGARRIGVRDYDAPIWADINTERSGEMVAAFGTLTGDATILRQPPGSGVHAGITWRREGTGPALVLFPLFLAPGQWDAVIPELARQFTVIRLGGRHVGGVALLERRAASPTYAGMVFQLLDIIAPRAGETILELGCGSGAVMRRVAQRLGAANPLTGADLNPFLLREAAILAEQDGLAGRVTFTPGNAESLPFPDASFDHAYSVTVLEECDADKALRELRRVVKPGGRVGVIVRAIDMNLTWHLEVPDSIRRKVQTPPQLIGPGGVADQTLYRRMANAGFEALTCYPALATFAAEDTSWFRYREEESVAKLDAAEAEIWRDASRAARAAGLLFTTNPFHCAVGRNPAN